MIAASSYTPASGSKAEEPEMLNPFVFTSPHYMKIPLYPQNAKQQLHLHPQSFYFFQKVKIRGRPPREAQSCRFSHSFSPAPEYLGPEWARHRGWGSRRAQGAARPEAELPAGPRWASEALLLSLLRPRLASLGLHAAPARAKFLA